MSGRPVTIRTLDLGADKADRTGLAIGDEDNPALGVRGVRLALAASLELERRNGRYALCTMCIGVGQGIALILERV